MSILTEEAIQDLVTSTLRELGRMRWNQIAQELQDYEVMQRIMRKDKVYFDSGTAIQRTLMINHNNAAKNVGLFDQDTINVADVLARIDIPWRHTNTHWAYDVRELLINRSPAKIVDLLETRRKQAMLALVEKMESNFWSKPSDASDDKEPFGVPYWIVPNTTLGHFGGNPAGFPAGAGNFDASANPKWRNFTGQYSSVTKPDLIRKMRRGIRQIGFKSPIDVPDFRQGRGDNYRVYVNNDTIETMEEVGEDQNENLGRDLAPMDGTMAFKRHPLVWVPFLDADTTDPVYMINFAYFNPFCLRGDYMRETGPDKVAGQHNVRAVYVDLTWNVLCTDRRRQAVFTR